MGGIRRKLNSILPAFLQATGLKAFSGDAAYAAAKGAALANGDAYYNTTTNEIRVRDEDGGVWKTVLTAENDGTFNIIDTTPSTTKDTGALVIEGGLGVEGEINAGGDINTLGDLDAAIDLRVGGNATITGDLTVNGTTTTVNSETLEVVDPNILINKGGNQATADDVAGITVEMSDATDASIIYDKDLPSRWKVGEVGGEKQIITDNDTQTLTNKTIDFSTLGTNIIIADAVDIDYDNTGSGLAATNAQTAIDENDSNIDTHIAATVAHGATGAVMGTTNSQVVTNKTIDADLNTISNLAHGAEVDNPSSGVHGVVGSVVGTTDSQTLTNKTIDAASNTLSNIGDGELTTGIDAAKLADGSVSNDEYQRLDGVTSDIQGQIDGKADTDLGNLAIPTAINQDLLPSADNIRAIGSSSLRWASGSISTLNTQNYNIKDSSNVTRGILKALQTLPSGALAHTSLRANVDGENVGISTDNDVAADANATGDAHWETGNKSAGTGNSGDLVAKPGTSTGGTRGSFLYNRGTNPAIGDVLTATDTAGRGDWATPVVPSLNQRSETATFTALITDDFIFADASTAAFTITLPTAVGNEGKVLQIRKTDTDWSKPVTIDGNAAETIGGSTTTTLNTDGETLKIVSDNSNWLILERLTNSSTRSFTPTGTWTTNTTYTGFKWRRGDIMGVEVRIDLSGAPNAVSLNVDVPDSLSIAGGKRVSTTSAHIVHGQSTLRDNSAAINLTGQIEPEPSTGDLVVRYFQDSGTRENSLTVNATGPFTWAANDIAYFWAEFPITEWDA